MSTASQLPKVFLQGSLHQEKPFGVHQQHQHEKEPKHIWTNIINNPHFFLQGTKGKAGLRITIISEVS